MLIEQLTYAGICHIGERRGLRLRGLALDDEGVLPDALDAACRSEPARLLVLNPTIHNPTTATMSAERCRAIAALAREHDLIVIEDDVYGRLPEQRAPPIAALAPERTIYITSASKSVAPGLRLGMLLEPAALPRADRRGAARPVPDLPAAHGRAVQALAGQRHRAAPGAAPAGRGARAAGPGARRSWATASIATQPTSYHLWLPLPPPWRTSQFVAAARERGVAVDPGSAFAVDRDQAPHAVRVSLSAASSRERLQRALQILAGLLDEPPARRREVI